MRGRSAVVIEKDPVMVTIPNIGDIFPFINREESETTIAGIVAKGIVAKILNAWIEKSENGPFFFPRRCLFQAVCLCFPLSTALSQLTLVWLMHQDQVDLFEPVKRVQPLRCCSDSRHRVERQQGLASEIVGSQNVVVHDGKQKHCRILAALLQRHRTANSARCLNS